MIRVLIVSHDPVLLEGMEQVLQKANGIRLVGKTASPMEIFTLASACKPHIVFLHLPFAHFGSVELIRQLIAGNDDLKILIVTADLDCGDVRRFFKIGACGYVMHNSTVEECIEAIRAIALGQRYMSLAVTDAMALNHADGVQNENPCAALAKREREVVMLVMQGMNSQEIAQILCLNPKTVNTYRYRAFEKWKVNSDVGLFLCALEQGLIDRNRHAVVL